MILNQVTLTLKMIFFIRKQKKRRAKQTDQIASPDLPLYYVNLFYPTLFGFPDFLTPRVKIQSLSAFSQKT